MLPWVDAHNHLQDARLGDRTGLISEMKRVGVRRCVVNATRESDWSDVEDLARSEPDFIIPAFGIHPWNAHTISDGWRERLIALLDRFPQASIGECGLDQWVTEPSLEIQRPVFLEQLRLAHQLDRAITIHCLKAWGPLFDAFTEAPPPSRFLIHSFGGSIEVAHRLIPLGAYFSFSGHFLHPQKSATLEVFRNLPPGRILLETDAPDMLPPPGVITHPLAGNHNHPANLAAIGQALAVALGMSAQDLADLTHDNWERCFG